MLTNEIVDNRCDLLTFTKTMFKARKGCELINNWHQKAICDKLEKVVIGDITRLIINIPPRSGKTELAVISFISWCMGNFPDSEFIHASYSKRLATTNTYAVRAIMQNETFSDIFSHTSLSTDSKAKDEFRTSQGGIVYAAGADGTITGYGAGKMRSSFGGAIVIDDPHKAGEASSDTMRNNVKDWFATTIESRKNNPTTPIIVIMQRLHEDDLSGWLSSGGNGEEWDVLKVPALDANDKSFWPEQFTNDSLLRMSTSNSYVFAGQYMQEPAPIGGGIFKSKWWQYYDIEPDFEYRMIYADTAQKTGEENDYSVLQCWGIKSKKVYLVDQVRGKWEAPQLLTTAVAFYNKHKAASNSNLRAMKIEDKASGTGLIQQMRQKGLVVQGIQRSKDKVTRGYDASPQVEVGNVFLPSLAPFLSDLIYELELFPNGKHDDQVDPLIDAIDDNLNNHNDLIFRC